MVNGPIPDLHERIPNANRILVGYLAAQNVQEHIRRSSAAGIWPKQFWTSHEALLFDYEVPQLRPSGIGASYLASTHWPWIGNRTRQIDGAHVHLLANVMNPVACKIGAGVTPDEVLALTRMLNPEMLPGRANADREVRNGKDHTGTPRASSL